VKRLIAKIFGLHTDEDMDRALEKQRDDLFTEYEVERIAVFSSKHTTKKIREALSMNTLQVEWKRIGEKKTVISEDWENILETVEVDEDSRIHNEPVREQLRRANKKINKELEGLHGFLDREAIERLKV